MTGVTVKVPLPASVYGYVDGVDGVVVGVTCCVTFHLIYGVLVFADIIYFLICVVFVSCIFYKVVLDFVKGYVSVSNVGLGLKNCAIFVAKFECKLTFCKWCLCGCQSLLSCQFQTSGCGVGVLHLNLVVDVILTYSKLNRICQGITSWSGFLD